ncbi:hypothetical protein, conserved [Leishmania tarentolae]|uniref:Uncharacterized protein n=1 Tax=Leishmania tarentolae TaxID=5689 RepID=A0A640KM47_LEITA|nr:hypothetical protein, conserved [Leishmania tarentolae]
MPLHGRGTYTKSRALFIRFFCLLALSALSSSSHCCCGCCCKCGSSTCEGSDCNRKDGHCDTHKRADRLTLNTACRSVLPLREHTYTHTHTHTHTGATRRDTHRSIFSRSRVAPRCSTMLPLSNVGSSASFRTPVCTTAVSNTALPGSGSTDPSFSVFVRPPPTRLGRKMSKDSEGIASRYLQQLGNTFICGAGKVNGVSLDELADNVAAAEGERADAGRTSSMRPKHNAHGGPSAIMLASSPDAGVVDTRQDGEVASATTDHRRRHQCTTPFEASSNCDSAFPLSSPSTCSNTVLPKTGLAHLRSGDNPLMMPPTHLPQAPGSVQRRPHGGPDVLASLQTTERGPGGLTAHLRRRSGGCPIQHVPHGVPHLSYPTSQSGNSTCNSSLTSPTNGELGTKAAAFRPERCRVGDAAAGEVVTGEVGSVVAKANSLVAEAAQLAATTMPPRRKLRGESERAAQALAQEHTKILLLMGRCANAVADMEDMLEVANNMREKTRQKGLNLLPMPTSELTSDVATVPLAGGASSRHQDRGDGHTTDTVTPTSLLDLTAVRSKLHKLRNDLLCKGSTNLDTTQLHRLVYQLDNHVDSVEEALEEEMCDLTSTDSETQPPGRTAETTDGAEPPPRQSLRQRLRRAKKEQEDLLEASSNLLQMDWLMESVDMGLLTDMGHPLPGETREDGATDARPVPGEHVHTGIPLRFHEDNAAASMHYTRLHPVPGDSLNRSPSISETMTATREWGRADLDPHLRHHASLSTTISEPSMVPLSLTDLTRGNKIGCRSTATPTLAAGVQQKQGWGGPKDSSGAPSTSTAHSHRLNLLHFMSEVLAQYELEHVDAATLLKNRPLSAPPMRPHHQVASPSVEGDYKGAIDRARGMEAGLRDAFSKPTEATAGDERDRRSAEDNLLCARRPPSSTPGAIAASDGGAQPWKTDTLYEKHRRPHEGRRHGQNRRVSGTKNYQKVLLRAQLRNLRADLWHDLHELCAAHNYVQLIEARRRELTEGVGKGDAEYAADMEQKLAGHRLQLEAAKRACEEAARREAETSALAQEWGQESNRARTSRAMRSMTSGGSQQTLSIEEGGYKRLNNSGALKCASPGSGALPADKRPSTTTLLHGVGVHSGQTAEEAVTAATVETELLREYIVDKGLAFTVVGVKKSPRSFAEDDAVATATHPKKKSGVRKTAGDTKGSHHYLCYELRVEKLQSAPPPASTGFDSAIGGVAPAPASTSSVAAVVQVATHRLMNLKMTVDTGADVVEVAKGSLVTMRVTSGDPARRLLTLTPAKPGKAVSYAHAFMFSAADAAGSIERRHRSSQDMWELDSTASAAFAFPTDDQNLRIGSRSVSLDSRQVRSAQRTSSPTGSAASGRSKASKVSKNGDAGKRDSEGPTDGKRLGDASNSRGGQSLGRARTSRASGPATTVDMETTKRTSKQGTGASPRSLAGAGATDATGAAHTSASPITTNGVSNTALSGAAAAMLPLPQNPPLSSVPRSVDEWGVPHAHSQMEAVEKNAVILTVLQTSDGEDGVGAAQHLTLATVGGVAGSAEKQMRGSSKDNDILSVMEGWQLCGAAALPSEGAGVPGMTESPTGADADVSVVDAIVTEILRRAMMDGTDDEVAVLQMLHSLVSVEEEHRGSASRTGSRVPPPSHDTDVNASQSASPQKKQEPRDGVSGGRLVPEASASREHLVSESAIPSSATQGMMPPPLPIASQSQPLHSLEAEGHGSELIRFDFPDDGATGTSTTPSLPLLSSAKAHPPHPAPRKGKRSYRSAKKSSSAAAGAAQTSSALQENNNLDSNEAEQETLAPPPIVVVERAPGSSKSYMLLPREAAASLLGPSLRDRARGRPADGGTDKRMALNSNTPRGATSFHKTMDAVPVASLSPMAAAHSVLPTTGAAAAAAADTETLSHVQKFLQTIRSEAPRRGETGVVGAYPTANKRSPKETMGSTTPALRTELDQLQEDARELFMMDPVRYDTVISELMEQAARALLQESAHDTAPSPAAQGTGRTAVDTPQVCSRRGPLPPLRGGECQGGGSTDGLTDTAPVATAVSFTQEKPFCASDSVPSMFAQFEAPEAEGDERSRASDLDLRAPQIYFSSAIEKRGSHAFSTGSGISVLPPLSSKGVLATTLFPSSQTAVMSPGDGDDGAHKQCLSKASLPPQPGAQRRATHALVKRDDIIDEAARHHRASCADAAAEVERILYEQMKAQLLLRAIIAKMKELWKTKQQHAEAKDRERLAEYRQRLIQRGLAAAWPLEHHRVLHLHKLMNLLDRQVGRVHGWLPHYSDSNVLMDALYIGPLSRSTGGGKLRAALTSTHAPLASWHRQRVQNAVDVAQDVDGVSEMHVCPRYLHYLPQRRMLRYMRLAKERRLLPLMLVRSSIHQSHNRHLLLGYDRIALEDEGEDRDNLYAGTRSGGWPMRKLPRRRQGQLSGDALPFREDRYEDMKTRGERERYRRRLQRTAAFQSVSKMYSPKTQQEADFPVLLHF